jgi:drug/metabolite transporter (DMT)-like permease
MKLHAPIAARLFGGPPNSVRGIVLMLTAAMTSSIMIACVRYISDDLHGFQVAFFRMFFGFVAFLPILIRYGIEPMRTQRFGFHALRSVFHASAMLLFFLGLSLSPLAKVTALFFSAPLFASLLALLILGEVVRLRRIAALVVGFVGTLVIVRPDVAMFDAGALMILGAAASWGAALIVIKVLSRTEASLTTTIYSTVLVSPFCLIAALPFWQTPTMTQLGWFVLIGALGSFTQLLVAQALKDADVSAVTPFDYTRLIWAALFGFLVFAEMPGWSTWLGGTMIFAAATYIAYRERQVKQAEERAVAAADKAATQ